MKKNAILTLCFLAFAAQAQTAAQMGMTEEEHANMHAIPPGNGASPDGGAWLVTSVSGVYVIHNAVILGQTTNKVQLEAGRAYRILPHKGALLWTKPGDTEPSRVPDANLTAIANSYPAAQ